MKTIGFRRFGAVLLFFCCLFLGFGCGKKGGNEDGLKPPQAYTPGKTTVLVPEAPGTVTTGEDPLILDFSNAGQGYFMGKLTQPDTKINIQITGPDNVCYKYFLTEADSWTAFPITAGNGAYLVLAYQEISDGQYASFGKVIKGMDVVHKIENVETDSNDKPVKSVVIESIKVDTKGEDYKDPDKM